MIIQAFFIPSERFFNGQLMQLDENLKDINI